LQLFGQEVPRYMQGKMILQKERAEGGVEGMIDPTSLEQSGAAPGALIFPAEPEEGRVGIKS